MVDIVYSTPRFLLHDYGSFLAFSATILPQRFNAIRYLHLDMRGGNRYHVLDRNIGGGASYHLLRHHIVRKPDFPEIAPYPTTLGRWNLMCLLIEQMKGLRELQMDMGIAN